MNTNLVKKLYAGLNILQEHLVKILKIDTEDMPQDVIIAHIFAHIGLVILASLVIVSVLITILDVVWILMVIMLCGNNLFIGIPVYIITLITLTISGWTFWKMSQYYNGSYFGDNEFRPTIDDD